MIVYSDQRWPAGTGIGVVQSAVVSRAPPHVQIVDLNVRGRIGSPFSPVMIAIALRRRARQPGVFWSAGYMPSAGAQMPAVATVHDLLHLHYYSRLHIEYYKRVLKPLYRKCSVVICVSEFTRREFLAWSQLPAEQVITIHNGIDREAFASAPPVRLPYPYVFYAGNRRVYKNLDRLLEAYARSRLPKEGVRLVLTGPPDAALGRWATVLGIDQLLHFAGKLADSEVRGLYRGAMAVAFVSLYEGFGLPVLEGMAAGVPVMTASAAAMPEVAGNAALLVDPKSTDEIAHALDRLCFDDALRAALINSGRVRAATFSWDACAARTWQVIERAAGGTHG